MEELEKEFEKGFNASRPVVEEKGMKERFADFFEELRPEIDRLVHKHFGDILK